MVCQTARSEWVQSKRPIRRLGLLGILLAASVIPGSSRLPANEPSLDRTGTQWAPFVEWALENPSVEGNPFDLQASVTFTHEESGEKRATGMFHDGAAAWKFRFTGTRPGRWSFVTASEDPDLDGHKGTVMIKPNPDGYGFTTHHANKWARQQGADGRLEAFVPQYVMYAAPHEFHGQPDFVDQTIRTFLDEHSFNGFHFGVSCRWFSLEHERSDEIDEEDPNPDPRTFEALEVVITKTHAAGGVVHIWAWGDEQRRQTPVKWGINGKADRRLQRYIAARLGPIPGWTMGYGFDLWEWVNEEQLVEWHRHMHEHLGWPHLLGARAHQHGTPLDRLMTDKLDYIGFESHRPDYATYCEALDRHPDKPVFMEDRFRIREASRYPEKDYDQERTRRGLWHSAMAGGVANIWGNLKGETDIPLGRGMSVPYRRPHWIRTYREFFRGRFRLDMRREEPVDGSVALRDQAGRHYLIYAEDAGAVAMDLSAMAGAQPAVAVDAKKPYQAIDLGRLEPRRQNWTAPYRSDWAIAVGDWSSR